MGFDKWVSEVRWPGWPISFNAGEGWELGILFPVFRNNSDSCWAAPFYPPLPSFLSLSSLSFSYILISSFFILSYISFLHLSLCSYFLSYSALYFSLLFILPYFILSYVMYLFYFCKSMSLLLLFFLSSPLCSKHAIISENTAGKRVTESRALSTDSAVHAPSRHRPPHTRPHEETLQKQRQITNCSWIYDVISFIFHDLHSTRQQTAGAP